MAESFYCLVWGGFFFFLVMLPVLGKALCSTSLVELHKCERLLLLWAFLKLVDVWINKPIKLWEP